MRRRNCDSRSHKFILLAIYYFRDSDPESCESGQSQGIDPPVLGLRSLYRFNYFFGRPYKLISFNNTPFVHPNPSCPGYSPPPAGLVRSFTSYFSINLPVCLNTLTFKLTQRSAISLASVSCP